MLITFMRGTTYVCLELYINPFLSHHSSNSSQSKTHFQHDQMERNRSKHTAKATFHRLLPLFFFYVFFSLDCLFAQELVGYGYKVESVNNSDSSGKTLTVNLGLVNSSSVYGPDISNLTLYVRYAPTYTPPQFCKIYFVISPPQTLPSQTLKHGK